MSIVSIAIGMSSSIPVTVAIRPGTSSESLSSLSRNSLPSEQESTEAGGEAKEDGRKANGSKKGAARGVVDDELLKNLLIKYVRQRTDDSVNCFLKKNNATVFKSTFN
jgi:hypothetical protein